MRIETDRETFLALSAQYAETDDDPVIRSLVPAVKKRAALTLEELEAVCRWKSPRALPHIRRNTELEVVEITRWALSTSQERIRIESLRILYGVSWAMASVILHWFHSEPYPILDVRAVWSLGLQLPASGYNFAFWSQYVSICRDLHSSLALSMREVDRALWQLSFNQGGPGTAA